MLELICEELGVEVGEKWEGNDGHKYRITKDGEIEFYYIASDHKERFRFDSELWVSIMNGDLKPVWKPHIGDTCWTISVAANKNTIDWNNSEDIMRLFEEGLVFKTKGEAVGKIYKILNFIEEGI